MAYESLDLERLRAGQPGDEALFEQIKSDLDFLFSLSGSSGGSSGVGGSGGGVPNGSFEITDEAGELMNWAGSEYPGGTCALETANPAHGAAALKFVHPGGSGNGGGYRDSDYVPVDGIRKKYLGFITWASAAGMRNKVVIRFFNALKADLAADQVLYDSTGNPSTPMAFVAPFTPPSTARYYKVRIIGGDSSVTTGGTAYFDGIMELGGFELQVAGTTTFTIAESTATGTAYADVANVKVPIPYIGVPCRITFTAEVRQTGTTIAYIRFRTADNDYSNEQSTSENTYQAKAFAVTTTAATGYITLYLQLKRQSDFSGTAYARKSGDATIQADITNL